ncbi:unnamed protein product, partial [Prorocentrum cordatum]
VRCALLHGLPPGLLTQKACERPREVPDRTEEAWRQVALADRMKHAYARPRFMPTVTLSGPPRQRRTSDSRGIRRPRRENDAGPRRHRVLLLRLHRAADGVGREHQGAPARGDVVLPAGGPDGDAGPLHLPDAAREGERENGRHPVEVHARHGPEHPAELLPQQRAQGGGCPRPALRQCLTAQAEPAPRPGRHAAPGHRPDGPASGRARAAQGAEQRLRARPGARLRG